MVTGTSRSQDNKGLTQKKHQDGAFSISNPVESLKQIPLDTGTSAFQNNKGLTQKMHQNGAFSMSNPV